MKIYYKILNYSEVNHQIVVRYWSDEVSELDLNVIPAGDVAWGDSLDKNGNPYNCRTDGALDIPIPMPPEKELEKFILSNAPLHWLEHLSKIKNPKIDTSMASLKKLVGKPSGGIDDEVLKKDNTSKSSSLSVEEIKAILEQIK